MYDTQSSRPWREAREAPRRPHGPSRVLVAEDDPEMRRIVVDALRRDGYEVLEVADGNGLLSQLTPRYAHSRADVDLVISDLRMPVCTGLQILEALRSAQRSVPVILMTAFSDEATRTRADALGAILFDKPFAIDDLRTAVVNLLPRT